MKKQIIRLLVLLTLGSLLATGCYTRRAYEPVVTTTPTAEVIVSQPPPFALLE